MSVQRALMLLLIIAFELVAFAVCVVVGRVIDAVLSAAIGEWQSDVTGLVVVSTLTLCWLGGAFRRDRGKSVR